MKSFFRRLLLDHLAGVHDLDAMRGFGDDGHVVGDEDERHALAALQADEQVEDLFLDGDVQRGGGFVGDEEARIAGDGHGDHDALIHAAGELMREGAEAGGGSGDADLVEEFDDAGADAVAGNGGVGAQGFGDLPADGVAGVQRGHRLLEDHGDVAADEFSPRAGGEFQQVGAVEAEGVGGDFSGEGDEAHDGEHRHAFAGAGFADDGEKVAFRDGHVDAVDGAEAAAGGGEFDGEVADFEEGHPHLSPSV